MPEKLLRINYRKSTYSRTRTLVWKGGRGFQTFRIFMGCNTSRPKMKNNGHLLQYFRIFAEYIAVKGVVKWLEFVIPSYHLNVKHFEDIGEAADIYQSPSCAIIRCKQSSLLGIGDFWFISCRASSSEWVTGEVHRFVIWTWFCSFFFIRSTTIPPELKWFDLHSSPLPGSAYKVKNGPSAHFFFLPEREIEIMMVEALALLLWMKEFKKVVTW